MPAKSFPPEPVPAPPPSPAPAAASDQDLRRFSALLGQNARQWRKSLNEALRPQGLTEATWLPLLHLHLREGDGPLVQKTLARSMGLDSSSVVRLLDGLETAGLVARSTAEDRRAKTIGLTAAGRSTVARVEQVVDAARARFLADVPAGELAVALAVMEKVAAALARQPGPEAQP